MTQNKNFNSSTFVDFNTCQTLEASGNLINKYNTGKRTILMNNQSSPKQVRFGSQKQIHLYPHLSTTIQQLKSRATTTVSNNNSNDTFI